MIYGTQLNGPDPGGRPRKDFRKSKSGLQEAFQQWKIDYSLSRQRKICYIRKDSSEVIDADWYRAKSGRTQLTSLTTELLESAYWKVLIANKFEIYKTYLNSK